MDFSEISRRILDILESWGILEKDYDAAMAALLVEGVLMEYDFQPEVEVTWGVPCVTGGSDFGGIVGGSG